MSQVNIVIYIKRSIYNKHRKNLRQPATRLEKCVELGKMRKSCDFRSATRRDNMAGYSRLAGQKMTYENAASSSSVAA